MAAIKIICKSFGYKYGAETSSDTVFDVRCLPNPFYIQELREKTGLESCIRDYVMSEGTEFFEKVTELLSITLMLYDKKGKDTCTVAFGCTGGKHRSVTMAYLVAEWLRNEGYDVTLIHRDIDKN